MGALKHKLSGSSMIEAIVASLIFLIVFVISLSTVTGFTLRKDEGYALLEAERQITLCSNHYCDGTWDEGTYTDEFGWGKITTVICAYENYTDIRQIVVTAKLSNSRKTIEYRKLAVNGDEQ